MPKPLPNDLNPSALCAHCSLPVPASRVESGSEFCCPGCEFVFKTLHQAGLENFYALRAAGGDQSFKPEKAGQSRFQHFNDPLFLKDFLLPADGGQAQIQFHLQGVHCAACVWLIERLSRVCAGVHAARLDFARAVVSVRFDPARVLVSEIAATLDSFGYFPTPVGEDELEQQERSSDRSLLLRIGVAGLSAGNTMMLSFSLYQAMFSGIEPQYDMLHKLTCLALAIPAVFYSAWPFYRTAWASLRAGRLHLDLPISIGILVGFGTSTWNTFSGRGHVYFDSATMLIFLLLLGRWAQQVAVKKAGAAMRYQPSFMPQLARRIVGSKREEIYVKTLQDHELVEVFPGEIFPVDGVVRRGASAVDRSILTGESRPEAVALGSRVFAGTLNLSGNLEVEVLATADRSRVGRLLAAVRTSLQNRAPVVELTDRLSGYFVALALTLSAITFFQAFPLGLDVAISRVVALLVITCPCALGLSAPLALGVAVSRAARAGIVVREPQALEQLSKVSRIYFDKTGTLTSGRARVQAWFLGSDLKSYGLKPSADDGEEIAQVLGVMRALEAGIEHPYAQAIFLQIEPELLVPLDEVQFRTGKGVEALDRTGRAWRLGSPRWIAEFVPSVQLQAQECLAQLRSQGLSPLVLESRGQILAIVGVGDEIKAGAFEVLSSLRKSHQLFLLSGDDALAAASVGEQLGFSVGEFPREVFSEQSPEQKMRIIQQAEEVSRTAMIGDGVNDAAALSAASVGIGVRGGIEACLSSAKIFVSSSDARALGEVFSGAERTINLIKLNLWISLIYNVLGVYGAMNGYINPLVAAIFMPLSSLSVVLTSTMLPTYRVRAWK